MGICLAPAVSKPSLYKYSASEKMIRCAHLGLDSGGHDAWHDDGLPADARNDSGSSGKTICKSRNRVAAAGSFPVAHELPGFERACQKASERADWTGTTARRPRSVHDVESRRASGSIFRSALRGRDSAHAEFTAASKRDRDHCESRGRPILAD